MQGQIGTPRKIDENETIAVLGFAAKTWHTTDITWYAICTRLDHNRADVPLKEVTQVFERRVLSCVSEIEEAISSALDVETEFWQLSKGKHQFLFSTFESNGVRLVNSMSTSRVRWQDKKQDHSIHLLFPTRDSVGGATGNGQPLGVTSSFYLSKPSEIDLVAEPNCEAFEIVIDESWVEDMGLPTDLGTCIVASERSFDRLQRFLRHVFETVSTAGLSEKMETILSEQVLGAVEAILLEAPSDDAENGAVFRNRHMIVARAEEIMNDWHPEARLEVSQLCRELGVPRSTLNHVFRQELGLGPMEFLRVKRLHKLRAKLLAADAGANTVADIAASVGFFELGRMAGLYRSYFNELPSETLVRSPH